jgi:hypothetical protein
MGNRSRRRQSSGRDWDDTRDPLYGIPDTNMPGLASIRLARALQNRRSLRGWLPRFWVLMALVAVIILVAVLAG